MKNDNKENAGCGLLLGLYFGAITAILTIANAIWSNNLTLFFLLSMIVIDIVVLLLIASTLKSEELKE